MISYYTISILFHICIIWWIMFIIHTLRASTSVYGYSCKIHKAALFTHFGQKNTHISGCKIVQNIHPTVQMNNNRVNIHGYCSCVNDFFILFSLSIKLLLSTITTTQRARITTLAQSINQNQLKINPKSTKNFPKINWKLTQTHSHRQINTKIHLLKKKKNIEIHKHTHTQTNPNGQTTKRDRCLSECSVLDWNDRSSWVSLDWSSWVWVLLDQSY